MILLVSVSLLIPNIYATTANQQNSTTLNNTPVTDNVTVNNPNTEKNLNTTASSQEANDAASVTEVNQSPKLDPSTSTSNSDKKSPPANNECAGNIQYASAAAGDNAYSNVQDNWFVANNITEAAGRVKAYIEANHKLPSFVQMGNIQVSMPQFLDILTKELLQVNKGNNTPIGLETVNMPANSSENLKTGSINQSEYLDLASRIQKFMNSTGKVPNFASSTLGTIRYESLIYLYSRILNYYGTNNVLPHTASMKPWENISTNTTTNSSNSTGNGYTVAQITSAAGKVQSFIEQNQRLPNYVQVGSGQLTMSQFLELLNAGLLQINGNSNAPIVLKSAGAPSNPTESITGGNVNKSEYLDLASRIQSYINSAGKAPNFASSTLGTIRYESLIYLESRIMNFYGTNNVLPKYAVVNPWVNSSVPSSMQQYLEPTLNCQSNNAQIISLANTLTAGKTSAYDKAVAIFNWVRDNIPYSFYYNTRYGAVGTLSSRTGNCVDHSHLLIALARAAGIPARYEQGECTFSDGTFGHVWAQLYVNGKWYLADSISTRNTFGVINNWDTSNWTFVGIYAELPF